MSIMNILVKTESHPERVGVDEHIDIIDAPTITHYPTHPFESIQFIYTI